MGAVAETETEDLEALFEQIAASRATGNPTCDAAPAAAAPAPRAAGKDEPGDIFHRVGQLTRNLHDALRELGFDKGIDAAAGKLPDVRARLSYIATLTGQAAEKTLSKAEIGTAIQQQIEIDAGLLAARWDDVFAGRSAVEEFKDLAHRTRALLAGLPERTAQASALYTDIMLAQDFHDLTGQVINKIADIAQNVEEQLIKLLIDTTPADKRGEAESGWLDGPVIDVKRDDVVTSQGQVDDLLASLGF